MSTAKVSIIIPSKSSIQSLANCLTSIHKQTYTDIETLIIESDSIRETRKIAKRFGATVLYFKPKVANGIFDAPHKRNYGVSRAKGSYVYYVDTDMELMPNVVKEAVMLCEEGCDAVIVREDSFGKGTWASAKNLERQCYWGDDSVEAPRFFKKSVWKEVGGLDENLGGGGDDWDLYQKLLHAGYKVGRIKSLVMHNEGQLSLRKLMRKRFMYGRDSAKYILKRPQEGLLSYFPIRKGYIKNWKLFIRRPKEAVAFVFMRFVEYGAGALGIVYSSIKK